MNPGLDIQQNNKSLALLLAVSFVAILSPLSTQVTNLVIESEIKRDA